MRRHLLALLIVINAASLALFHASGQAKDRTESGNEYFERNIKLNDDGTGKMPLFGPERMCKMLKKGDPRCLMSTDAFCAIIYNNIARGARSSVRGTVCPPKAK